MAKGFEGVICIRDCVRYGTCKAACVILPRGHSVSVVMRHRWLVFVVASTPGLVCRGPGHCHLQLSLAMVVGTSMIFEIIVEWKGMWRADLSILDMFLKMLTMGTDFED